MSASATTGFPASVSAFPVGGVNSARNRRRSISPQAGHTLIHIGHAIEYLTEQFVHEGGTLSAHNSQLQAVQLLMTMNRQVYLECPEVQPLGKCFLSLFQRWTT